MNEVTPLSGIKNLSDQSRVWVYQADREMTDEEINLIELNMQRFVEQWAAHGKELFAGFSIVAPYFLIIAVDDTKIPPSGCSIDASVHFIQDLQKELNIDFFNRLNVVYVEREEIQMAPVGELVEKIKAGAVSSDIHIYQNLVDHKSDLENNWLIPLNRSWVAQQL